MKEKNTKKGFHFEGAKPVGDKFKGAKIAKAFRFDMNELIEKKVREALKRNKAS